MKYVHGYRSSSWVDVPAVSSQSSVEWSGIKMNLQCQKKKVGKIIKFNKSVWKESCFKKRKKSQRTSQNEEAVASDSAVTQEVVATAKKVNQIS
jgi:hypothetical protein